MRKLFGLAPAPEFLAWLEARGIFSHGQLALANALDHPLLADVQSALAQPLAIE
jgi:ethanolamine ammonia-lyase large subunit